MSPKVVIISGLGYIINYFRMENSNKCHYDAKCENGLQKIKYILFSNYITMKLYIYKNLYDLWVSRSKVKVIVPL